ncbi:MAG: hypothetical protein HQL73_02500 [Magnetococcales bacterium]|nr:hypothetical protein [Magnetococcales bacterium]
MAMISTNSVGLQNLPGKNDPAFKSISETLRQLAGGGKTGHGFESAAMIAIADRMTSQLKGTNQARMQINDGIATVQVAGGALEDVATSLQQLQDLATRSANGSPTDADRQTWQQQAASLWNQIQSTISDTSYNDHLLLASDQTVSFQSGPNAGEQTHVGLQDLRGLLAPVDLTTQGGAEAAMQASADALQIIQEQSAQWGAIESQLTQASATLSQGYDNQIIGSRILNADMADRASSAIALAIRSQAGLAVQVQADRLSGARVHQLVQ